MKRYVKLNPELSLRNDDGASYLIKVNDLFRSTISAPDIMAIPPFLGKIFSEIGKHPYNEGCTILSTETGLSEKAVNSFIEQLVNSDTKKKMVLDDQSVLIFPENILIDSDEPETRVFHQHKDWKWDAEFHPGRPSMPTNVNLMPTLTCNTDCLYCYANRKLSGDLLSVEELSGLIEDLYSAGVINLTLTGGDIFAMKDWQKVVKAALSKGYHPFISTKTPLTRNDILLLKGLGYTDIQFSLDSNIPAILKKHLKVDGEKYLSKVENMLQECDENNLKIQIRTVITSLNSNLHDLKSLYGFLSVHPCIKEWDLTPAFFSPYRGTDTIIYKPENKDLSQIYDFAREENLKFPVAFSKVSEDGYCLQRYDNVEDFVAYNMICKANYNSISILANGDCVLCEMLYEAPDYRLGNIRENSVKELWNSEKALFLYNPPQDRMAEDSPCHECQVYSKCKQNENKRICYVNIKKTGGSVSSPDPACPLAPHSDLIL